MDWLVQRMLVWIPLVLSLTVHEWAHAETAYRLGDDTADQMGRRTLDPFAHIDPLGTFVLPLLGVPFGWATPVPIQPLRFRGVSMRAGVWMTALAGPLSNVLMAMLAVAGLLGLAASGWSAVDGGLWRLLSQFMTINVGLAMFNLMPYPPLDGSRIVDAFLPDGWRPIWDRLTPVAPVLAIATLVVLELLGVGLSHVLFTVDRWVRLAAGVAGG